MSRSNTSSQAHPLGIRRPLVPILSKSLPRNVTVNASLAGIFRFGNETKVNTRPMRAEPTPGSAEVQNSIMVRNRMPMMVCACPILAVLHILVASRLLAGSSFFFLLASSSCTLRHAFQSPFLLPVLFVGIPQVGGSSSLWAVASIIFSAALFVLGSALAAFLLFMRPAIKQFEKACLEMEVAMKKTQKACDDMSRTADMFEYDVPRTLDEMKLASREFEILGKDMNAITETLLGRRAARRIRSQQQSQQEQRGSPPQRPGRAEEHSGSVSSPGGELSGADLGRLTQDTIEFASSAVNDLTEQARPPASSCAASTLARPRTLPSR